MRLPGLGDKEGERGNEQEEGYSEKINPRKIKHKKNQEEW